MRHWNIIQYPSRSKWSTWCFLVQLIRTWIFHLLWCAFVACWLLTEQQGDNGWKPQPRIKGFLDGAWGPVESYRDTSTPRPQLILSHRWGSAKNDHQGKLWRKRALWATVELGVYRKRKEEWQRRKWDRDICSQILMDKVDFLAPECSGHSFSFCSCLSALGPSNRFLGLSKHSHFAIAWGHGLLSDPSPLGICHSSKNLGLDNCLWPNANSKPKLRND